jgi:hypothetical protein
VERFLQTKGYDLHLLLTLAYQENIPYPSPWTCWAALLLEAEELSPVPRERRDSKQTDIS